MLVTLITILGTAVLWLASLAAVCLLLRLVLRVGWADALFAAYPLWWMAQVLVTQALSLVQGISQVSLLLATLGMLLVSVAGSCLLLRAPGSAAETLTSLRLRWAAQRGPLLLLMINLAGWGLVALVTPSLIFDTNAYHLPSIATWLQQGSLDDWPTACLRQITRTHAGSIQQLWVIGMAHADPLGELPCLLATLPVMLFVWRLCRRWRLPHVFAQGAVVALWTMPQFVFAAVSCKDDLLLAAGIVCGLYLLLQLLDAEPRAQHLYAILLAAAIALVCGTKVPGLLFGGILGVLALFYLRAPATRRVWPTFLGASLLFAIPTYLAKSIMNVRLYGILYPEQLTDAAKPGLPILSGLHYYYTLFMTPLTHLFPQGYDEAHYGLFFILGVLPAACWAYTRRWRRPAAARDWSVVAVFLALAFGTILLRIPDPWDQRFMLWVCPTALVVALPVLARWVSPAYLRLVTVGLAILVGYGVVTQLPPLRPGVGDIVHRQTFHEVADLPYYTSGYAALRGEPSGSTVLYIGGADTFEYPCWGWRLERMVLTAVTPAQVAAMMARQPDWLVIEKMANADVRNAAFHLAAEQHYTQISSSMNAPNLRDARSVWRKPPRERARIPDTPSH